MSRLVQINTEHGTREDLEPTIAAQADGQPVHYLGIYGPNRGGDDPWTVHTWRIGGQIGLPVRAEPSEQPAPPAKRTDKTIYRREVWTGSGQPVGPVSMARDWPTEVVVEFPAPVVGATTEGRVDKPKPVLDLEDLAAAHGWDYMTTYACGWVPHATTGRKTSEEPKESWGVRLRRGGRRAVAVRMGASWASLWTWSGQDFFQPYGSLEAFLDAVCGPHVKHPSGADWDKMLVKYPKRPTAKEWLVMRSYL